MFVSQQGWEVHKVLGENNHVNAYKSMTTVLTTLLMMTMLRVKKAPEQLTKQSKYSQKFT